MLFLLLQELLLPVNNTPKLSPNLLLGRYSTNIKYIHRTIMHINQSILCLAGLIIMSLEHIILTVSSIARLALKISDS